MGAVEAALELQDLVALAKGAGHPEGEEGRLAARRGVAQLLGARHGAADLIGEGHRGLGELEVGRALPELRLDGGEDGGMGVSQHHGPAAQDVIDVLAPGEVVEMRPPGFLDHELEIVRSVVAAEDTAGEAVECRPKQCAFLGTAGRHGVLWRHRGRFLIPQRRRRPQASALVAGGSSSMPRIRASAAAGA